MDSDALVCLFGSTKPELGFSQVVPVKIFQNQKWERKSDSWKDIFGDQCEGGLEADSRGVKG